MTRNRFLTAAGAAVVALALMAGLLSTQQAQAQAQTTVNIGVIAPANSPTLFGVSLAVEMTNARGGLALPDGSLATLGVVAVEAKTPDEVSAAIGQLKQNGVVAIFGPDNDALAGASLPAMAVAGVPYFTAATSTKVQVGGFVFRTRASDTVRMNGLADALLSDFNAAKITIYQGNPDAASATSALVVALARRSVAATPVLQDASRPVADAVAVLLQGQPDTIVAFGESAQLAELYQLLYASGYRGTFATDLADDRTFINAISAAPRVGIVGITGWTYAWEGPESAQFTRDYLFAFGEVPNSYSAAAYDAANVLLDVIRRSGTTPSAILAGLLTTQPNSSVQGIFNPLLGNGETTANSMIIETNNTGAPKVIARFNNTERLTIDTAGGLPTAVPGIVQPPPTLVAPPTQEFVPTPIVLTATPEGVELTVLNDFVNVRYGPGQIYDPPIGRLPRDTRVRLTGTNSNYTWFTFNFQGQQAWVTGDPNLVSIFGNPRTLPVVPTPPTPTPAFTPTPVGPIEPDIQLVSALLTPNPLKSGQPFVLTVTVRNAGANNAGQFAVAAAFDPGGVFGAAIVPGLASGQATTVNINYPGVGGTGTFTIAIVLDLNREVNEGPVGEANNLVQITYQVVP